MELWLYSRAKEHEHEANDHCSCGRCQRYLHNFVLHHGCLERADLGYFLVGPIGEVRMSETNGPRKNQHDS